MGRIKWRGPTVHSWDSYFWFFLSFFWFIIRFLCDSSLTERSWAPAAMSPFQHFSHPFRVDFSFLDVVIGRLLFRVCNNIGQGFSLSFQIIIIWKCWETRTEFRNLVKFIQVLNDQFSLSMVGVENVNKLLLGCFKK